VEGWTPPGCFFVRKRWPIPKRILPTPGSCGGTRRIFNRHRLSEANRICDFGIGAGHWSLVVASSLPQKAHLVGIDYEQHWVDVAGSSIAVRNTFQSVEVVRADVQAGIPLEDGSFDLVTCQTVLMHLADPGKALGEMMRLCRPGGSVVIVEPINVLNRAQFYDALQLTGLQDATALLATWLAYHFECRRRFGYNYDIAATLPELLREHGVRDHWMYQNPSMMLVGGEPNLFPGRGIPKRATQGVGIVGRPGSRSLGQGLGGRKADRIGTPHAVRHRAEQSLYVRLPQTRLTGVALPATLFRRLLGLGLDLADRIDHGIEGQHGRGVTRLVVAHGFEKRDVSPFVIGGGRGAVLLEHFANGFA
jgi:SAM-dependent methyltransferase